jgi:hypothetical protein
MIARKLRNSTMEYSMSRLQTRTSVFVTSLLLAANAAYSADASIVQEMTAETAAPYLGVYWFEPAGRPIIVVLDNNRLALELPGQSFRELRKTEEPHMWAYASKPQNTVKFLRDGDGPATAIDMRQPPRSAMLKRVEPEAGLPSLDDLFKRRPDQQRTKKLASLGTLRLSGSIDATRSQFQGPFELLAAGIDHSRIKRNVNGQEVHQVVAGGRAWTGVSTAVEESAQSAAKSARLQGWLLASGDWRGEFKQTRVMMRVDLDGKPVFLVHATPHEGRHRLMYLDTETGLLRGYDEVREISGMGITGCEVRFADYRDVEGVQIPFKMTVKYPDLGTQTYQVDKIETRLKFDRDPFTL